jgi:CMP-N-acetylneuraminic acid synthetase
VRPEGLIDRAIALFYETGCDSVQSYAAVGKHHPTWTARVDDLGRVRPWEGDRLFGGIYRRQDLTPAFVPDGGVIVVRRACLDAAAAEPHNPHAFLGRDHRAVTTEPGEVVDIDCEIDLAVADQVLRRRLAHP